MTVRSIKNFSNYERKIGDYIIQEDQELKPITEMHSYRFDILKILKSRFKSQTGGNGTYLRIKELIYF